MILPQQIKAARSLLGWSQIDLAQATSLGVATVKRIEVAHDVIRGRAENLWRIEKALENGGVIFIPADETAGPGVRLKREADRNRQ